MVIKEFGIDFHSDGGALTLSVSEVTDNIDGYNKVYEKIHPDGWHIKGKIIEDYFEWVNDFVAIHPEYGKVHGNFEYKVYADSEEGFKHFMKNHPPEAWDYGDI